MYQKQNRLQTWYENAIEGIHSLLAGCECHPEAEDHHQSAEIMYMVSLVNGELSYDLLSLQTIHIYLSSLNLWYEWIGLSVEVQQWKLIVLLRVARFY